MKIKSEALKRFLESGFDPLDAEMTEALTEPKPAEDTEIALDEARPPKPRRETLKSRLIRRGLYRAFSAGAAIVLCVTLIALLLFTVMDMPYFGAADTLVGSELSDFYIRESKTDTRVMNVISAIILNYRGFDTLGESHVLFIAVCSVLILLRMRAPEDGAPLTAYDYDESRDEPHDDLILKTTARFLVPLIAVFGFYIILNGNLSPGGGFSGGAVVGAGLILYLSVYGYRKIERFFTYNTFRAASCAALITYSLSKGYHFITGANGWESGIGAGEYGSIFSGGLLLPLNICVGLVVACTMYALFTLFRKGDF